jgi:hypothetical protein
MCGTIVSGHAGIDESLIQLGQNCKTFGHFMSFSGLALKQSCRN